MKSKCEEINSNIRASNNRKKETKQVLNFYQALDVFIQTSGSSNLSKFLSFSKYTPRQVITEFLVKYELYKLIFDVPGCIVECGVFDGQGLMSFAHFSTIFEPVRYTRRIVGFDTFSGFVDVTTKDKLTSDHVEMKPGGLKADSFNNLKEAIRLFDMNRFLNHIPKILLVKGDVQNTIPEFLEQNPELVISLLYLDMDLYEPTKCALKHLYPRLPRGGVLAFDEINHPQWPGETIALLEKIGINNVRLKQLPFDSRVSYLRVE